MWMPSFLETLVFDFVNDGVAQIWTLVDSGMQISRLGLIFAKEI